MRPPNPKRRPTQHMKAPLRETPYPWVGRLSVPSYALSLGPTTSHVWTLSSACIRLVSRSEAIANRYTPVLRPVLAPHQYMPDSVVRRFPGQHPTPPSCLLPWADGWGGRTKASTMIVPPLSGYLRPMQYIFAVSD